MSESLEDLKAIIDGATESDLLFDGRYLNSKMHVRGVVDRYSSKGVSSNFFYDAPLYVRTNELRSLSDIKRIIELMEG